MSVLRKAVIVGAGPVGCLAAVSLAGMGWDVVMFESRPGGSTHAQTVIFHPF
jgi:2-polyprenyl-6-methoxyphenol hydroxylase-like FAD-dependent oxidoreductase